jgi:hypothetical protein
LGIAIAAIDDPLGSAALSACARRSATIDRPAPSMKRSGTTSGPGASVVFSFPR